MKTLITLLCLLSSTLISLAAPAFGNTNGLFPFKSGLANSDVFVIGTGSTNNNFAASNLFRVFMSNSLASVNSSNVYGQLWSITNGGAVFPDRNIIVGTNNNTSGVSNSIIITKNMHGAGGITGADTVFISPGDNSGGGGDRSVTIGTGSGTTVEGVAIGSQADAFGLGAITIGANSSGFNGVASIHIGYGHSGADGDYSISIGSGLTVSAPQTLIIASDINPGVSTITNAYIQGEIHGDGGGLTNIPPSNLNWTTLSTAAFTNGLAARIPVYTNAGTIYYLNLWTNTP